MKSAWNADKAGRVSPPGLGKLCTHADANMVDPRNSEQTGGGRRGNKFTFFEHLKWQRTTAELESE